MRSSIRAALIGFLLVPWAQPALANRESDLLRARGANEIYNLDQDQAIATYRRAIAADPQDTAAYRGLATALWLTITYRRGNITVDDYLGRGVSRPSKVLGPPSTELAAMFQDAIDRALSLARKRIETNPGDTDGHYQLGAAVGLRASYTATVEGHPLGAFRAAREAYDEHEKVIQLDQRRKDAGLIIGTYRYIVSTLSLPGRWVAYVAGFGGGKERGLRMIEEAASYPGENRVEARLALFLIYNREKRYSEALEQLALLRAQFPRNRLFWLESGATNLRAGRAAEAEHFLQEGFARLTDDYRPRMFGEESLWYYKRGLARAVLGRATDAQQDFRKAISLEGRKWVHARAHLELGKLALNAGQDVAARQAFHTAIALAEADNDDPTADEARSLSK